MTTEELGELFPIIIRDFDKNWENYFNAEKELILELFEESEIENIKHIGSTAVPDLKAKPTIDILIEISEKLEPEKIIEKLELNGYQYIHRLENPPPHMMFVKGYSLKGFKGNSFHIHVRYKGDWDELYFRDYLRKNRKTAKEYEALKLELAIKFRNDRDAYTNAKTDFIEKINKLAREDKT